MKLPSGKFVHMIFWDFFLTYAISKGPPRVVKSQKIFGLRGPWAGLGQPKVWAQLYVVKLEVGPDSPLGPRGPKLGGTFIHPQDPSRYHPKTFGFHPPTG